MTIIAAGSDNSVHDGTPNIDLISYFLHEKGGCENSFSVFYELYQKPRCK